MLVYFDFLDDLLGNLGPPLCLLYELSVKLLDKSLQKEETDCSTLIEITSNATFALSSLISQSQSSLSILEKHSTLLLAVSSAAHFIQVPLYCMLLTFHILLIRNKVSSSFASSVFQDTKQFYYLRDRT